MFGPWRTGMPDRPGVAVPPHPMPAWRDRRPLKRWRWIGGFGDDVIFCAAQAHIAGIPVAWWAVWDRRRRILVERTAKSRALVTVGDGIRVQDGPVSITVDARLGTPVETISPHGGSYIWTRKTPVALTGTIDVLGHTLAVDCAGLVDDSAGYHARRTAWTWLAGAGTTADGRAVVFNHVAGLHDAAGASERTLWVDGEPQELDGHALEFAGEASRVHREDRWLLATDYEQPFGAFSGSIGGLEITGQGVTERHAARW